MGIAQASQADATLSPTHRYSYDDAGNRTQTMDFGQTVNYTANAVNAYTALSGGGYAPPAPTYDARGNTLRLPRRDGGALNLAWTAFDRLASVNGSTLLRYDALGRLTWVRRPDGQGGNIDEVWSWSGWTLLNRDLLGAGGTLLEQYRYTWGPDLSGSLEGAGGVGGLLAIERATAGSSTWEIRHVHSDANGNVLCLTDAQGQPSARYRYDAFGNALQAQDLDSSGWAARNLHRFSTKPEVGGTGLLYYGYRWYDPVTGRWPSRDPIEEAGGVNLYGFVYNNPIDGVDLLGENPILKLILRLLNGGGKAKPTPRPPVQNPQTPKKPKKPKKNTGDCTPAQHAALSNKVGDACKNQMKPFSCKKLPHSSCQEFLRRAPLALACARARREINQQCFKGGDPAHKAEQFNASRAATRCRERYRDECTTTTCAEDEEMSSISISTENINPY